MLTGGAPAPYATMVLMWTRLAIAGFVLAARLAAETISGRVVEDHTGSGIASAEVRVFPAAGSAALAELDTDAQGRFHADLPDGTYRIEIAKANYTNAAVHFQVDGAAVGLPVRLVRCGVIAGHISDSSGRPIRGARVTAMLRPSLTSPWRPGTSVQSDDRGQYRIYGLPAGEYAVAAQFNEATDQIKAGVLYYPDSAHPRLFTVSGGEEFSAIDFAVAFGGTFKIAGAVEGAKPGVGYSIALTPVEQPSLQVARANTAADGTFHFEGIPGGRYFAFATGPVIGWTGGGAVLDKGPVFGRATVDVGGLDVDGLSIKLGAAQALTIILNAPKGGGCPASERVTLRAIEDWGAAFNLSALAAVGREQRFERVPPGRFQVMVSELGDGCFAGEANVDLSSVHDDRPVVVPLAAAGAIRGRLAGTERAADYVVLLMAEDVSTAGARVQAVFPGLDGRFQIAGLRPGRYRIAAQQSDGAGARWMPDLSRMVEIEIPGGSTTELEIPPAK